MALKRTPLKPGKPLRRKSPMKARRKGLRHRRKGPTKSIDQYVPWSRKLLKPADDSCFPIYRGMPCYLCKSIVRVAGHHIIPRSESGRYRHDIRNLVPLCWKCHCAVENQVRDRALLMERIRCNTPSWYAALILMMQDSKHNPTAKPDYHVAIAFWKAHEGSGRTVAEALHEALAGVTDDDTLTTAQEGQQ